MDTINESEKSRMNQDQGFVKKPFALKKLVRAPDGTLRVVYVDARTGKEVNPEGYTVIQSDNTIDTTQVKTTPNVAAKTTETKTDESLAKEINTDWKHTGENDKPNLNDSSTSRNAYGYYNKPGWMGFASFVPGPIGLVGKLGNLGINASNTEAVNNQREALGFTPNSTAKNILSTVFDQQGYIGELSVPNSTGIPSVAPVSFEATDSNQRTAYTPEEARLREQLANAQEATKAQQQAAIETFNQQFPEQQSFMSRLASSTKGLFSNLFGGKTNTVSGGTNGGSSGYSTSHFPDRPNVTNSDNNSPDDRDSTNNGGYSSPGLF